MKHFFPSLVTPYGASLKSTVIHVFNFTIHFSIKNNLLAHSLLRDKILLEIFSDNLIDSHYTIRD